MHEEVAQDVLPELVDSAKGVVDVPLQAVVPHQLLDLLDADDDRVEDARHLRVLVDEHQRVGHVVVAQMDHARTHPASQTYRQSEWVVRVRWCVCAWGVVVSTSGQSSPGSGREERAWLA